MMMNMETVTIYIKKVGVIGHSLGGQCAVMLVSKRQSYLALLFFLVHGLILSSKNFGL